MEKLLDVVLQLLLIGTISLHLSTAPFTKVEESFNIQATHDILFYGIPWTNSSTALSQQYDHVEFSGSVPRTFIGALVVAGFTSPWIKWMTDPQHIQFLVRGCLGLLNGLALLYFQNGLKRTFGRTTANWFLVLQGSQFHVIYYASRTLPNIYAFILTTLAFRSYIIAISPHSSISIAKAHHRISLYLLTIAGVIFRSEIAVLVATQTLFLLITRQASLTETIIPAGATGLTLGLLLSIPIDSFFWQQFPLWPELTGFYYNTILGKSSDWGVSPWHFYFTSSLPRLLLNPLTYGMILLAAFTPATRTRALTILIPTLSFVALYSFLPHKEWRFIVYVVPPLTAVSSLGASWVWTRRTKSIVYATLTLALLVSVVASLAASYALLAVSSLNYPGGEAVIRLREVAANEMGTVRVYADNLVCQTGLTRFLEARHEHVDIEGLMAPRWVFDKTEDQTALSEPGFWRRFDYALVEDPNQAIGGWEVVGVVEGFAGVRIVGPGDDDENNGKVGEAGILGQIEQIGRKRVTKGWWARIKMEPKVMILKRDKA